MSDERVEEMVAWARSRIDECRRQEVKFAPSIDPKSQPSQALIEAWSERRALQAVLRMLGKRDQADAGKSGGGE